MAKLCFGLAGRFRCLIGVIAPIAFVGAGIASAQETVSIAGCVAPGAESSCAAQVNADGGGSYSLSGAATQPAWSKRVKVTAKRVPGAGRICGTPLADIAWTYDLDQKPCAASSSIFATSPSPVAGLGAWAGTYETQTKWGGASGTWRDTRRVVIDGAGKITLDGKEIQGALFSQNMLLWFAQDGNQSTVRAAFARSNSDPYFFNPPVQVPAFQGGWLQANSPAGWLDFRGRKVQ